MTIVEQLICLPAETQERGFSLERGRSNSCSAGCAASSGHLWRQHHSPHLRLQPELPGSRLQQPTTSSIHEGQTASALLLPTHLWPYHTQPSHLATSFQAVNGTLQIALLTAMIGAITCTICVASPFVACRLIEVFESRYSAGADAVRSGAADRWRQV